MNKLITGWLLVILGMSCNYSNVVQKSNGYTIKFSELGETQIYHDGVEVNILKIKSKYFETYIPETWVVKVKSDSVFVAIDTLDKLKDNIAITHSRFDGCTIEKIREKKEKTILNSGYAILSKNSDRLKKTDDEILIHDIVMEVKLRKLKQRCYYLCTEDKSSMCCLTTTIASFEKKELVFDMTANFLMNSIAK